MTTTFGGAARAIALVSHCTSQTRQKIAVGMVLMGIPLNDNAVLRPGETPRPPRHPSLPERSINLETARYAFCLAALRRPVPRPGVESGERSRPALDLVATARERRRFGLF